MANYSVNQNRQVYIAKNGYSSAGTSEGQVTKVAKTPENELYFLFNGAAINGVQNKLKSDYIPLANITSAKAIDATKNVTYMKKVEVTLNATPVAGQDYVLGINFKNFFSSGDGSQYYKDAAVHVTAAIDNAKKLFDAMKIALDRNFSHEDGATASSNPYLSFTVTGSGASAKLVIEEKAQEWELGTKKTRRVMFDVFPSTIYTSGDDVIWGTVTEVTNKNNLTGIGNGQKIADLEWFALGERGDQYRNVGWPNVIPTKYLAEADKQYDLIELHFAYTGTGVSTYRSEKEITIAAPLSSTSGHTHDAINGIIGAINTAAGSTLIATLSEPA